MDLGSTLNQFRQRALLTKKELARRAGITTEGCRLILKNMRIPTPETLEAIIEAAKISEEEAVRVREEAMMMRIVKSGFDPTGCAQRMWTFFKGFLIDEGVDHGVDMEYVHKGFMEAAHLFLIPEVEDHEGSPTSPQ